MDSNHVGVMGHHVQVDVPELASDSGAFLAGLDIPIATHPLEIAAALESSGCRDVDAQALGWPDTFSLAEHLFARQVVERLDEGERVIALPEPSGLDASLLESTAETERHLESQMGMRPQWRVLLRGILFALPGLALAGALPLPMTAAETALLMVTLGVSWGVGQGVAYGVYMRVSISPGEARTRLVPWVVGHALAMATVVAAAVALGVARPLVGVVAFAQATYLIAASGLMALGRERYLYALMTIGALAGSQRIVPPLEPEPEPGVAAVAIGSMLAATVLLLWMCRPAARGQTKVRIPVAGGAVSLNVLYGMTSAALVLWLPWYGRVGIGLTFIMTPLVLSLGVIEWLLLWLRSSGRRNLATSDDLGEFKSTSTRTLRRAAAAYLATLVVMVGFGWLMLESVGESATLAAHPEVVVSVVALGMFLFFAAVAVALFGLPFVLTVALVGAGLLQLGPFLLPSNSLTRLFCLVCLALVGASYYIARRQVRIPANLT